METYKESFRAYYDKHHQEKKRALRRNILLSSRAALGRLGADKRNGNLLDIGCGTGELLKLCEELNVAAFGLDISAEGLRMARQYGISRLTIGDQEALPFKGNNFDYVTLISTLEYSMYEENIKRVLKETQRVMKKGGNIYIEVRNGNFLIFKILNFLSLAKLFILEKNEFRYEKNAVKASRWKDLSYSEWNRVLYDSGFKIDKVWKSYKPLFPGSFVYFAKTLIVNMLNMLVPASLCYRICFLCRNADLQ